MSPTAKMLHRTNLAALALLLVASCGGESRQCLTGSECASGVCNADGTCEPELDAGPTIDGASSDGATSCRPDHDGTIARDEILLAAGRNATFRVALDATVDTAGTVGMGGERTWDFSQALAGESDVVVELTDLGGAWYEDVFPGASYATRLSQTEDLLGIFELTDDALLLRGVVSPDAGVTRTELTYDPPIVVLELPLETSSSWSTSSTVSGLAGGVSSFYSEDYEQQVDALGTLETPFGPFPVHRVRSQLTRTVGIAVVTLRSFSYVAECFGIVGQVSSKDFESEVEFTDAAEVSRLAP